MRVMRCLTAVMLGVAFAIPCSAALAAGQPPLSAAQLIYPHATVETRLEVSGIGATQLIGGALAAHAYELRADAKAAQEAGASEQALAEIAESISRVESTKEVVTSFLGFVLVVMKPGQPVKAADFVEHYQHLMSPRGWSPLATVQHEKEGDALLLMLAPGEKGIFLGVSGKEEMVTGLVTTSKPLGKLLASIFHTGEGSDAMAELVGLVTQTLGQPQPKAATAPEEQAPAPQQEKE